MKAVYFDGRLSVRDIERPVRKEGEVLIQVQYAGICNTDFEITRGYVPGFDGVLGHEFIGIVTEADDPALLGRRVTVEINCACGSCEFCRQGLGRHCTNRTVLGIIGRNGVMAEFVAVPKENVVLIPDHIPDRTAVFIEPLAAALEILEQRNINSGEKVLLIGDGKLALLIALVMKETGCDLTVVGKHDSKLGIARNWGIRTILLGSFTQSAYDVVIEASGNSSGFDLGLSCVKPRGTLVLKSTYGGSISFNPARVVVDEITIIGSRCGRFEEALRFLDRFRPDLSVLISGEFDIDSAVVAFAFAAGSGSLKVLLRP